MKFLVRNEENSRNFPTYFFTSKEHLICPKSAQKRCTNFFPKKPHIFGKRHTIFDPPKQFLLHFYALIFFRYQILQFFFQFSKFFSIFFPKKVFFRPVNSSFSSSVFLVRNSSSSNSSIPRFSRGIATRRRDHVN